VRLPARVIASFSIATALIASTLITAPAASAAAAVDRACTTVEGIFAPGSGQGLGEGEFAKFNEELFNRVNRGKTTYSSYELGTEAHGGAQYKPVAVSGSAGHLVNAASGFFSSGGAFFYGESVNRGVAELDAYLEKRRKKCETTIFVLGGYSQGAQVIGETYVERMTIAERQATAFNILVGDPKLSLPEGKGFNPPACRGEDFSEWRRGQIPCDVDGGSLFARDPYLETNWTDATGLWCNADDFVCGSSKNPFNVKGHGEYRNDGNGITQGAIEAAKRIKRMLPVEQAPDVNDSIEVIGTGTTGTDVVFTIDSTGSMGSYINQAREYARTMASSITELRGRVALVEYRDAGDSFVAEIRSPLSSDLTQFTAALDKITVDGGGDTPEALLAALMTGLNGLDWKPGATKAAVVLTDAGFHNPDVSTGDTVATVAKRALEIDPVNVYPVVPQYLVSDYAALAEATSGQIILNEGDTAAALTAALELIKARPVPMLPLLGYTGLTGDSFVFDASKSYVIDSTITDYAFDFNGDGVFETSGTSPTATYTYPGEFSGVMQVRVTAADGGIASASATVNVTNAPVPSTAPAAPTDLAASVVSTVDGKSVVDLTWTAADTRADRWLFQVNGVLLAADAGAVRTVRIGDVDRSASVTFSVSGLGADDISGGAASVVLDPPAVIPDPSTPGTPGTPGTPSTPGTPATPGNDPAAAPSKPADSGTPTRVGDSTPKTPANGRLASTGMQNGGEILAVGGALLIAGLIATVVTIRRRKRVTD
jgi:Mg-chelatase subunit ChlD